MIRAKNSKITKTGVLALDSETIAELTGPEDVWKSALRYYQEAPKPSSRGEVTLRIRVVVDSILLIRRIGERRGDCQRIQYKHDVVYCSQSLRDGRRIVFPESDNEKSIGFVLVECSQNIWEAYLAKSESAIEVVRFLRAWHSFHLQTEGFIRLHAAAAILPNQEAVMILGDSGSGKTTTLMELCSQGAIFIANDKLLVRKTSNPGIIDTRAYPLSVRIGQGTLHHSKHSILPDNISRDHPAHHWINHQDLQDAKDVKHLWGSREKLELTPSEFCSSVNCSIANSGLATTLLFVNLSLDLPELRFSAVNQKELLRKFRSGLLYPVDPDYPESYFGKLTQARSNEALYDLLESVSRCRAYSLSGHPIGLCEQINEWFHSI